MSLLHFDSALASVTGAGTALYLAAEHQGGIDDPVFWVKMIPAVIGPFFVVVANRVLAMKAAKKRLKAIRNEREAAALEADKDPTNDAHAKELREEAEELRVEADALVDKTKGSE